MIHIDSLLKDFDGTVVLRDVTLNINAGERVSISGYNGSGKTTLVRCLLGLQRARGTIRIFGLDPRNDRQAVLSDIAFVPQHPPALKGTVQEFLTMASKLSAAPFERVRDLCLRLSLDIESFMDVAFRHLSGGMKQKLLIAVALARHTRLLIFDEPTASLDPESRSAFLQLLSDLPPGAAVVVISHRLDEFAHLLQRHIEIDGGRIVRDTRDAPSPKLRPARLPRPEERTCEC